MLGKLMLVFVLVLGPSTVRAMPGNVCADISPTSPNMDNPMDPRVVGQSQAAALRIPTLLRDVCAP